MNKRRLLKLARFLQKLPEQYFDLESFTTRNPYTHEKLWKRLKGLFCKSEAERFLPPSCGTTGCAVGWCPAVFPTLWEWKEQDRVGLKGSISLINFGAAVHFFNLDRYDMVHYLFHPRYYAPHSRGPRDVANRIFEVCKKDAFPLTMETYVV